MHSAGLELMKLTYLYQTAGLELMKLTYTRPEDNNLISHRSVR